MTDSDRLGPWILAGFFAGALAACVWLVLTGPPQPIGDPSYDPSTATPFRGQT